MATALQNADNLLPTDLPANRPRGAWFQCGLLGQQAPAFVEISEGPQTPTSGDRL
jgi:hypothetical protein